MNARLKLLLLFLLATLFWLGVARGAGVGEPWDAARYLTVWYPVSLLLAAGGGYVVGRGGWAAGGIVTLAQLPVMGLGAGTGGLWPAGLLVLLVLAMPAMALAALAGRIARRGRDTR